MTNATSISSALVPLDTLHRGVVKSYEFNALQKPGPGGKLYNLHTFCIELEPYGALNCSEYGTAGDHYLKENDFIEFYVNRYQVQYCEYKIRVKTILMRGDSQVKKLPGWRERLTDIPMLHDRHDLRLMRTATIFHQYRAGSDYISVLKTYTALAVQLRAFRASAKTPLDVMEENEAPSTAGTLRAIHPAAALRAPLDPAPMARDEYEHELLELAAMLYAFRADIPEIAIPDTFAHYVAFFDSLRNGYASIYE